jgi:beta-glucosidase
MNLEPNVEQQVEALLAQMTLDEKVAMVHGATAFDGAGCERLGIPGWRLSDGPMGCKGPTMGETLSVPQSTSLAATFDETQVYAIGVALGEECNDRGVDMLLGPTVNLHRSPLAGRHFECFSEDPYLSARMAVAYIDGLQSTGTSACVKHFVCNDQEHERMTIDVHVDERTLREVYLPPFEAAVVEADSRSVMSAYNFVNGHHASAQPHLLVDVLKGEWGFDGVVVSDWGSIKETVAPAVHGLDMEMPGPGEFWGNGKLQDAVADRDVLVEAIDDKVRRILRLLAWRGRLQGEAPPTPVLQESLERRALVRAVAADGMVLLKNDGVLPLAPGASVALLGSGAAHTACFGGGSAHMTPYRDTNVLAAMRERWTGEVTHATGIDLRRRAPSITLQQMRGPVKVEVFAGKGFAGSPVAVEERLCVYNVWHAGTYGEATSISVRATFTMVPDFTGPAQVMVAAMGEGRAFVDGVEVADNVADSFFAGMGLRGGVGHMTVEAGREYTVVIESPAAMETGSQYKLLDFGIVPSAGEREVAIAAAVAAAAAADVAVVVVGSNAEWESEGEDRNDLHLPLDQDELVRRVIAANPRTVVVLNCGAPVAMPWLADAAAVVVAWMPGQEGGEAIADVLTGAAEPGGRLPTTWAHDLRDTPSFLHYPGAAGVERYGEELWVGHRWYDARGIEPMVPFGHGGSYTTFAWGAPTLIGSGSEITVEVPVTNTGARSGCEVVQVYVQPIAPPVLRPVRHLAGFAKVRLAPGETTTATIDLDERSFARWDVATSAWKVDAGEYGIVVAASAADLRGTVTHRIGG